MCLFFLFGEQVFEEVERGGFGDGFEPAVGAFDQFAVGERAAATGGVALFL
jgi:hypothetical protein